MVEKSNHRRRSIRIFQMALWWALALALVAPAGAATLLVKSY
ncbi:MAG: hypothetical protein R6X05_16835 [Desulfobacterales bacterium]